MFKEDCIAMCLSGERKRILFYQNRFGYLISSMLAGMFISLGSFASMSIGGLATAAGSTNAKFLVSFVFAAALSLVIGAGCELFTGNAMVLSFYYKSKREYFQKSRTLFISLLAMLALCWIGNLIGSWILVLIFQGTGITQNIPIAQYFANAANVKIHLSALQLITRGILCNICVCLAVWCSVRLQNEAAKLIMVFWCILIFMICGFEHSVANMSIIGVALLNPCGFKITLTGYLWNLLLVTIGNTIGAIVFVEIPYNAIAKKVRK